MDETTMVLTVMKNGELDQDEQAAAAKHLSALEAGAQMQLVEGLRGYGVSARISYVVDGEPWNAVVVTHADPSSLESKYVNIHAFRDSRFALGAMKTVADALTVVLGGA